MLLPVAISYDRVPEEEALLAEMRSGDKPEMKIGPLLGWMSRALRGKIRLGHVHLSCGRPVILGTGPDANDDVHTAAREVMGELQRRTVATTHHLEAFLQSIGQRGGDGIIDLPWLRSAIEARGGEVIESQLPLDGTLDPELERTLRRMFTHLFYPDALARFADHPHVVATVEREHFSDSPVTVDAGSDSDPRLDALLEVLFAEPATRPAPERPEPRSTSMFAILRELVGVPEISDRPTARLAWARRPSDPARARPAISWRCRTRALRDGGRPPSRATSTLTWRSSPSRRAARR